jgi:predicted ATPase/DNA-binding winged helix-turn-helix (wHTH) protein
MPMAEMTERVSHSFAFDDFVLIPERQQLLKDEAPVRIGGRALDLLTALVERPGEVVSKRELMEHTWPDVTVEECNLKVNMGLLRRTLGDDVGAARYIATVTGRGYRFIAPVSIVAGSRPAPTPTQSRARNHNLPFGITRIFGRVNTIDLIDRDLETSRLVSIVGPGGIGKTTVALAVAENRVDFYPDGVWLVDLSPLVDPTLIPTAIATVVGMAADSPNVLATLCEFLRDRRMLILLDSCEHLIARAVYCVEAILAAAPAVRILATTREPLRLGGERVRRLAGLDVPPVEPCLDAKQASSFSAVELFVDRATDRLETFRLTDDVASVAGICRKLDGHALAIELAATRVGTFGVKGILEQFNGRFGATLDQRGGPDRHRTLTATIEWSYRLLPDIERLLMQRLSTFAGAFDLDAACAVATDAEVSQARVLEGLASLVDKSLVSAELRGSEVEYRLWDATRSYALDRLCDSGAADQARRRHAEHCLTMAARAAEDDPQLSPASWSARHAHVLDETRVASAWAFNNPAAAELGVRLTIAAIPLWRRLSLAEECRVAVERALDDRLAPHRSSAQELVLLQTMAATLLNVQGTLPEVKVTLERALAIAVSLNDTTRQIECLRGLSEYELWTGDSHAVLALSEKMRAISGGALPAAEVSADAGTGSALEWLGELDGARHHLAKALNNSRYDFSRFSHDRFEFNQRLVTQVSMTHVLWMQGFADQAQATARRMVEEAEASHYAWPFCFARFQATTLALHLRDYDTGKRLMDEGMEHAAKHGITFWRDSIVAGAYARWQLYKGQLVDLAKMQMVLSAMRERGSRMYYPHLLTNYGEAVARQKDVHEGLAAIDEAIGLCEATGQIVVIPEILRIKGNVIRWELPSQWRLAKDCYREAIERSRHDGTPAWEIRAATSLVKLTRRHDKDGEAEAALDAAYGRFSEGFATGDLIRARALLDSR